MARYSRRRESGERPKKSLGEFGELLPTDRYSAAKKAAEAWFEHLGRGGKSEAVTVKAACLTYIEHVRSDKGERQAADLKARLTRWVLSSKLANLPLSKLTEAKLKAWRSRVGRRARGRQPARRQRAAAQPRARALFREPRHVRPAGRAEPRPRCAVTSPATWRGAWPCAPSREPMAAARSTWTATQRRELLAAASPDVAPLAARPGPGASCAPARWRHSRCRRLDTRLGVLTVGRRQSRPRIGASSYPRPPPISSASNARDQAAGRAAVHPRRWQALVQRTTGRARSRPPPTAAGLPAETVAYTLRHSAITDLVTGGLDLLTVAQLAGTSVAMIERHYGHLRGDHAAQALERLAL
jgi:hypothetical protein